MRRISLAVAAVLVVGCGPAQDGTVDETGTVTDMAKAAAPTGKTIGTILNTTRHDRTKITYHNGPVMAGAAHVYFIWYGNWNDNLQAQVILGDFVSNLGLSPYFQINSRYPNAAGQAPSGAVIFGGAVSDSYSLGPSLSDADISSVVSNQFAAGTLPQDPSGIYVVLGSADVTATSGFCTQYCGQHHSGTYAGTPYRYIFVGNADRCPSACSPQALSPNGNAGADAMANILANELSNAVTDPNLTGWYDRDGFDAADKCAWTFGATYTTANGALANVRLGSRDFLLQQNWYPTSRGGVCVLNASQAQVAIASGQDILPL